MNLRELELRFFRNYEEQRFSFAPGVNLIVGSNAQGKTNLLEAISFLGSGRSFRAQKTGEMVGFSRDFAEITGKCDSQGREQTVRWVLYPNGRPRQLWRNGVRKKSAGDLTGDHQITTADLDLVTAGLGASSGGRDGSGA